MKPPVPSVQGRRCLITGAASGIGRATAIAAARRGAELVLTDIDEAGLLATRETITGFGGATLLAKPLDISDHDAVAELARESERQFGALDVLMNIAGVSAWGSIDRLRPEHWQRMIDINLMGPVHVLESFVPPMIAAGSGGHIVNVSSAAGLFGLPWHAAYSASKFGIRGVSEVLRFDLRPHRIGVSLVCPGAVRTPLVGSVDIVGVDREAPAVRELAERFERHAAEPEHVAEQIIRGVERNRYMVFTSTDIRVGYWFQRKFAWPYELAMRLLNRRLVKVGESARI